MFMSEHRPRQPPAIIPAEKPTLFDPDSYIPTAPDIPRLILTFCKHIRPCLPPELALTILHFADYYPRTVSVKLGKSVVSASSGHGTRNVGIKAIVVTDPLPCEARKVNTVRFWMNSRDQGWSGEAPEIKGTYRCSWTWFEACILRPKEGETTFKLAEIVERGAADVTDSRAPFPEEGWEIVKDENGRDRWEVQRNLNSSKEPREHVVEWTERGLEADAEDMDGHWHNETGTGDGEGFVGLLKPGDRVVLLARATYMGWANHVNGARVEVLFSTMAL